MVSPMSRWAILALGVVSSVALPVAAQGGADAQVAARAHFDEGTQAFEVGDYERAATAFRAAYELTHHPDLLFNIYSALERGGDVVAAADALEGYLRDGDPEEERRASLQARLSRLRARAAEQRASRAEAELEAEREGRRRDAEERSAPADVEPAPADDGGGGVHPAAIGVLVGGGALLASFAVFAALAAVENDNLASTCSPECGGGEVATLSTFNLIADISWIGGAVAAATGLVLLFVLPAEGEDTSAAFAPWVAPSGAGGTIVGRF